MAQVVVQSNNGCGGHIIDFCHNNLECGYRYLEEKHLRGRTPVQSFIQADEGQVRVDHATQPCQNRSHKDQYDGFVKKHILEETFDRTSQTQWRRYKWNATVLW